MATAIQPHATNAAAIAPQKRPLWRDLEIPVIIGTGEYGQGKTIFGLSICPGSETLVYDLEGSSLTYRSVGFTHVDMAAELNKKYPNGYTAEQRYLWWRENVLLKAKSGKFRVLMVDPVSEIEDGLAEHVRKNAAKFDLTDEQIRKAAPLFWAAMKKQWKADLELFRPYFETIYMTVHLRDEFVNNARTGKREPKGKDTICEVASLFLWFEREKNKATGKSADIPSAIVMKTRLAKTRITEDGDLEVVAILPPRIPEATPKGIRKYIDAPPDYSKLAKDERVLEKEMSESEKLILQASIASNQAAAASAEAAMMEKRMAAASAIRARAESTVPASDASAEMAASRAHKTAIAAATEPAAPPDETPAATEATAPASDGITDATRAEIRSLVVEIWPTREDAIRESTAIVARFNASSVAELSEIDGRKIVAELLNTKSEVMRKRAADKLAASGTTPTVSVEPDKRQRDAAEAEAAKANEVAPAAESLATPDATTPDAEAANDAADLSEEPGTATKQQLTRCEELANGLAWAHDKQVEFLAKAGCKSFRNLSEAQMADLISKLEARMAAKLKAAS